LVADIRFTERRLTGNFRVRAGYLNRPILQVEEECKSIKPHFESWDTSGSGWFEWRDATMSDVLNSPLFTLVRKI